MPGKRKTPAGVKFDACVRDVSAKGAVTNPSAVCASTMRRAYGATSGSTSLADMFEPPHDRERALRKRVYVLERAIIAGDNSRATRAKYIRAANALRRVREG